MVLGAKDHLSDLVKSGRSGHRGSDGSLPGDRISRYGTWSESVGENIIYHSRRAREDVISLIIDDGVANRGHRKNIFRLDFHVIGVSSKPTPQVRHARSNYLRRRFCDVALNELKVTFTTTPSFVYSATRLGACYFLNIPPTLKIGSKSSLTPVNSYGNLIRLLHQK